jgi:hypothetical protein
MGGGRDPDLASKTTGRPARREFQRSSRYLPRKFLFGRGGRRRGQKDR